MRIAFCGKGGSGKTSIGSMFIRYLVSKNEEVLAIDGDINQHLSHALMIDPVQLRALPRLGHHMKILKEYVKGNNPLVEASQIIESTPAGYGSNFITFKGNDPVSQYFVLRKDNLRFIAIGGHEDNDVGTTCYHKFTGAEGIFLNHLLDTPTEFVIGDMCAGADPFASSGLASRYDAIYLVLEPTLKSLSVYEQARQYADPFGIKLYTIANKIMSAEDIAFIEGKTGQKCMCTFGDMSVIRSLEKGQEYEVSNLDAPIAQSLEIMRQTALSLGERDWDRYIKNGKFFHQRSSEGWASAMYGADLMKQVDPKFHYLDILKSSQKEVA